jgi:hypothetical protein
MASRILACLVFLLVFSGLAAGQSDTFAVVSPWVVVVYQQSGRQGFLGTGFISTDGYIVTAAHVIHSDKLPVYVTSQGPLTPDRMRMARVVRINRDSDVAVLDAGDAPPAGLLPQQTVPETGDEAWVFGYEFPGDRAAILRIAHASIGQRFQDVFQLDGPIQSGFSGGPVTTRGGRVIGITSFGLRGSNPNLGYIVPDSAIQHELASLISKASPVASRPLAPPPPESGALAPSNPDAHVIVPGQRLGPIFLSSSLTDIEGLLGEAPDSSNNPTSGPSYTWTRYGITAAYDTNNRLILLFTWNPVFHTTQGINVGTSAGLVERTFGKGYDTFWSEDNLAYFMQYRTGITFMTSAKLHSVLAIAIGAVR